MNAQSRMIKLNEVAAAAAATTATTTSTYSYMLEAFASLCTQLEASFSVLLAFTNKFNSFIHFLHAAAADCSHHKALENLIKVQIVCGMCCYHLATSSNFSIFIEWAYDEMRKKRTHANIRNRMKSAFVNASTQDM